MIPRAQPSRSWLGQGQYRAIQRCPDAWTDAQGGGPGRAASGLTPGVGSGRETEEDVSRRTVGLVRSLEGREERLRLVSGARGWRRREVFHARGIARGSIAELAGAS